MNNIIAGHTNILVAKGDYTFSEMGLNITNTRIVYSGGASIKSWIPGRPINTLTSVEAGSGYYLISKIDMDLKRFFYPSAGGSDWLNVTDYKTGGNTWYNAFSDAHADCPPTGKVIYIPAGLYDMTGLPPVVFTKPVHLLGAGGANGATKFKTSTANQTIFDVNVPLVYGVNDPKGYGFKAEDIWMENTATTATAGSSAIKMSSAFGFRMKNCFFKGFYDTVDIVKGFYWSMETTEFSDATRWSLRIRDVGIEDGGDQCINNCWFGASTGQQAQIRYESGGGLKMTNTKFNSAGAGTAIAFDMVFNGVSLDLLLTNNSFENFTGKGISLDIAPGGQFSNVSIIGNEFLQSIANTKGIYMKNMTNVTVIGNTMASSEGSSDTAIDIVNCNTVKLLNSYSGYSGSTPVKVAGSTNVKRCVEEDISA